MKKRKSLGYSFPDEVSKVTLKSGHFKKPPSEEWKDVLLPNFDPGLDYSPQKNPWRAVLFLIITIASFFTIFLRLFHLQVVMGKTNRELADGNRIQIRTIHAPRGVIFDRNGKVLASNSPGFRLLDPKSAKVKIISREQALEMEVKNDPKTLNLEVDNIRTYPEKEKLAQVIGYVGEISPEQLNNLIYSTYRSGDRIGQSGIEAQYETILRGVDGGEIIEVDSQGKKLRTLRTNPPIPGQNIYLTIDTDFQKLVYDLLDNTVKKVGSCCASALAQDPLNGQILALVSLPSFDPNIFTSAYNDTFINETLTRSDSPILNRAISGTYPPGSTFKIVSALAALASGKITPQTKIEDTGVVMLGSYRFTNWYFTQYGKTEGLINITSALKRSNDTFFYKVSQIIGEQALIDWSRKLNLGKKMEIDLPGEQMGLVPDNDWKIATFGQLWYPGDTLHMSIGQGFVLTTPLQVLGFTSFVAAGGNLFKPQVVLKVTHANKTLSEFKAKVLISNLIEKKHIDTVAEGLLEVPKLGGTAWPFFNFPIETAGKTGTAEFGDRKNQTHAWYTSYAPANDPKISMTVLIEAGGEGSTVASPIIKEAFRWYLSPDKTKLIKDIYQVATESAKQEGE